MSFKHSFCVWLFVAAVFGLFQTKSAIAAPGEFTLTSATPGCNGGNPQITLNWTTSSAVMSYDIYRDGVLYVRDIPATGRSFPDTGSSVAAGVSHTYFLRAKNDTGSTDSNSLQGTAPSDCGGLQAPAAFTLTSAVASCNGTSPQIDLSWTTSVGALNYDVYRDGVLLVSIFEAGRSFTNIGTGVTPGVTYTYFIRARNSAGTTDSGSLQATASSNCGATPGPGAFTLTSATPSCTGTAQITLSWTASSGATAYDVYRDARLYSTVASASTLTFVNAGADISPGITYAYFIRARNSTGTRDSSPLTATRPANCGGTQAPLDFTFTNRGGITATSDGTASELRVGWGRIQIGPSGTTPSGLAIFGLRQNNVLVTEAAVTGSAAIQSGRIYAEIDGAVNTGLAIANPNNQSAALSFFFTDQNGNFGSGSTTIPPNGQIAKFLDQAPFNGRSSFSGTFTFNSSVPVSVIALRGLSNERGEFLITTLPVADLSIPASQSTLQFSHFADGAGWSTQVILVNPSDAILTGSVQFRNPSGQNATVTVNGQAGSSVTYSIPARSSGKLQTSGGSAGVTVGSVRVVPATGSSSPSGLGIFSLRSGGMTVAEAGVPDVPAATAFRLYAEAAGSVQTGLAVANTTAAPATVTLELTRLDGSSTGLTGTMIVPANGQSAMFLDQVQGFASLQVPFRGVLRVSSAASISVLGLRGRYNERNDFLITTTPPINENASASSSTLYFPHFADSGGYTTQFILFSGVAGQASSGTLQLFSDSGQTLNLTLQ